MDFEEDGLADLGPLDCAGGGDDVVVVLFLGEVECPGEGEVDDLAFELGWVVLVDDDFVLEEEAGHMEQDLIVEAILQRNEEVEFGREQLER